MLYSPVRLTYLQVASLRHFDVSYGGNTVMFLTPGFPWITSFYAVQVL